MVPATWTMRPISDRCCKELGYPQNWWQDPDRSFRFTGTVSTDGSCSDSSDDRLRRAGCAVVQFGAGTQPLRFGSTCPGPRTVSRAELYEICCAVKYGTPPLLVITDSWIVYKGIVSGIGEMASRVKSPMVDLWKQLHHLLADWPEHSFQVRWVPSHSEIAHEKSFQKRLRKAQQSGPVDPAWLEANRCADQWASKARALDAIPAGERTKIKKVDSWFAARLCLQPRAWSRKFRLRERDTTARGRWEVRSTEPGLTIGFALAHRPGSTSLKLKVQAGDAAVATTSGKRPQCMCAQSQGIVRAGSGSGLSEHS